MELQPLSSGAAGQDAASGTEQATYRSTQARRLVIELLGAEEDCLSAEEIHVRLKDQGIRIGLATVYRTVNLLSRTGAIGRIDAGDGVARFESSERNSVDHHHHLICRSCHRVRKYAQFSEEERDLMKRTERILEQRFGYHITGHRIYFEGICPECQARQ